MTQVQDQEFDLMAAIAQIKEREEQESSQRENELAAQREAQYKVNETLFSEGLYRLISKTLLTKLGIRFSSTDMDGASMAKAIFSAGELVFEILYVKPWSASMLRDYIVTAHSNPTGPYEDEEVFYTKDYDRLILESHQDPLDDALLLFIGRTLENYQNWLKFNPNHAEIEAADENVIKEQRRTKAIAQFATQPMSEISTRTWLIGQAIAGITPNVWVRQDDPVEDVVAMAERIADCAIARMVDAQ